jgi:DNA processing protein
MDLPATRPADPGMPHAERLARLRLARTPRIGPITFRQMLAAFGSATAAIDAIPGLSRRGGRPLQPASRAMAEREIEQAGRLGARVIVWGDAAYPRLLARANDAPIVLTCHGDASLPDRRCVAIVGARNASINGQRLAERLAGDLAAAGWVVVSGLARGIDTAAHRGAGPAATVAVQAGGVDVVYPPENAPLHRSITQEGGAVVSEMPSGLRPQALHFPRRNRIVSGLSAAVVVVEATARSGSLITARTALDQGRGVLAVPGFPLDPRSAGPNGLIRDGATLVTCADDVLAALDQETLVPPARPTASAIPAISEIPQENEVDDARRRVMAALGADPTAVDELVRRCHLSAPVAQAVLLELELGGRLQRHPGNQVSLVL